MQFERFYAKVLPAGKSIATWLIRMVSFASRINIYVKTLQESRSLSLTEFLEITRSAQPAELLRFDWFNTP
jgi:hypothetical protein